MSSPEWLIVGLGNPGAQYAATRHNIGFQVADMLAERLNVSFQSHSNTASQLAQAVHQTVPFWIAKPQTYMNRSGHAAQALCTQADLDPSKMLVIVDDLHLDTGQLRLRPKGSSGGHNGLQDIANRLETTHFPRLRIGIGQNYAPGAQSDYVLAPFSSQQEPVIEDARIKACNAVLRTVNDGLTAAMNRYNG